MEKDVKPQSVPVSKSKQSIQQAKLNPTLPELKPIPQKIRPTTLTNLPKKIDYKYVGESSATKTKTTQTQKQTISILKPKLITPIVKSGPAIATTKPKPTTPSVKPKQLEQKTKTSISPKDKPLDKKEKLPIKSKKPDYKYAGNESITKNIGKSLPEQLIPTNRSPVIFSGIFIVVLCLALLQFPFDKMMAGNIDIVIGVGYPFPFLEFELTGTGESPVRLWNLLIDLIIYIILTYAIDISINIILQNPFTKSKEEIDAEPVVFKDKKPTVAEKVTKKVFDEPKKDSQLQKTSIPAKVSQSQKTLTPIKPTTAVEKKQ